MQGMSTDSCQVREDSDWSPGVESGEEGCRLESQPSVDGGLVCGRRSPMELPAMAGGLFQQGQHRAAVSRFSGQSLPATPLASLRTVCGVIGLVGQLAQAQARAFPIARSIRP